MMPANNPLAISPVARLHNAQATSLVECRQWRLPWIYSTQEQEAQIVHDHVGLMDISAFGKVSLWAGNGESEQLNGQARIPVRGAIWLDIPARILACRPIGEHVLLLATDPDSAALHGTCSVSWPMAPMFRNDVTSSYAGFGFLGPRSEILLHRLASTACLGAVLPPGSCMETSIAGTHGLVVRPKLTTVLLVLVYVSWDMGAYVWQTALQAGRDLLLAPIGLQTWQAAVSPMAESQPPSSDAP